MKLADVLALRPAKGADASTIADAISRAETVRSEMLRNARSAEESRAAGLLTLDDKAIDRLGQEGSNAQLIADRIAALLPDMHADLMRQRAAETLEKLREQHGAASAAVAALEQWHRDDWPKFSAMLVEGVKIEMNASVAVTEFESAVKSAYRRPEVEDAGPLGLPVLTFPQGRGPVLLLATLLKAGRD